MISSFMPAEQDNRLCRVLGTPIGGLYSGLFFAVAQAMPLNQISLSNHR
jgi:hypothetical protein